MPEIPRRDGVIEIASSSASRLEATVGGGVADAQAPGYVPTDVSCPVLGRRSDTTRARSFEPGASTPWYRSTLACGG
ncbi:hypothetical protein, partial [Paraliomyxa miuraensis]|uniref:hypothetical protein n=1 Tax=Paraliomyxa miuraensis TaxID=376150 RepID=UPI0022535449